MQKNIWKSSPQTETRDINAVLFDFDGTLAHLTIDFAHMRRLVLNELAGILGPEHPALSRGDLAVMELIYAACRNQDEATVAQIAGRAERAVSAYEIEMAAPGNLFPQVEALLRGLKKRGLKVGIVTRNCRAAVEKVFPQHAELCEVLICRGDVKPDELKPKPGQLLKALALLGCTAAETLMVGDHPIDIISGKAAGCLTAGVLTGNSAREAVQESGPDWLENNVADLFAKLGLFKKH